MGRPGVSRGSGVRQWQDQADTTGGPSTSTPASPSLGDPLVPGYGNGGYDVSHYGITLSYGTTTRYLVGRTVVTARLTQNLSRFDLDFALPVRSTMSVVVSYAADPFDVSITTSKADQAITNGALVSRRVHGPGATTRWRSTAPMATYLTFLDIGR